MAYTPAASEFHTDQEVLAAPCDDGFDSDWRQRFWVWRRSTDSSVHGELHHEFAHRFVIAERAQGRTVRWINIEPPLPPQSPNYGTCLHCGGTT